MRSAPPAISAGAIRETLPSARTGASTTRDPLSRQSFEVIFEFPDGSNGVVEVGDDEFILEAGRRAGLELPSLCEQGWCTTCAVKIEEGAIDQSASRRYYEQDREAGFGLICTGIARSDLRLKTHQSGEMRKHRRANGLPAPRATGL